MLGKELIAAGGGLVLGVVGTLIGAGGGFLLMPALAILKPSWSTEIVTAYSLATVTANASTGALSYWYAERVDRRDFLFFAAATIPGAVLGAYVTQWVPRMLFDRVLGAVLLVLGAWLLSPHAPSHHMRHGGHAKRKIITRDGMRYAWSFDLWIGILGSMVIGFLSSLLGIGGGILHVPFLVTVLDFPEHVATATSHAVLAVTSAIATLVHFVHGDYRSDWHLVLATCAGAMIGAPIGARLSSHISGRAIMRILAIALSFVGLRLLITR